MALLILQVLGPLRLAQVTGCVGLFGSRMGRIFVVAIRISRWVSGFCGLHLMVADPALLWGIWLWHRGHLVG